MADTIIFGVDMSSDSGKNIDLSNPVQIADGIYWIGFHDKEAGLHCNPYLLIDGDEAVLFDPGSVPHFPVVLSMVCKLVSFDQITHIVVSHQDPDLCGAIPRFEELIYGVGGECDISAHTRASVLISHYGVRSKFYNVDMNGWKLTLKSGRTLEFIFTPYLHFPGAYMTYDSRSKILFSGDVFGAFSFDWNLFANEYYLEAMKAFHENYMPGKNFVNKAMEKLEKLDIKIIAPQHGSIINKDAPRYINALKDIECGDYLFENGD